VIYFARCIETETFFFFISLPKLRQQRKIPKKFLLAKAMKMSAINFDNGFGCLDLLFVLLLFRQFVGFDGEK
jgi:hypothetical protein